MLTGEALKLIALLLVVTQAACITRRVPPPAAPEPSMPEIGELPDSGDGMARVVIATTPQRAAWRWAASALWAWAGS